ncbi:hypothetical protein [uncultured Oxalicibacterium sp.]|uniref:hypothetical protein n=1 Tax=uncultured Oxalicibacterium sp. TaxID=1168540 RepID=UPI0025F7AE7D|nr:hypothetical protein [uncultured Oxalicibacterium sp.]
MNIFFEKIAPPTIAGRIAQHPKLRSLIASDLHVDGLGTIPLEAIRSALSNCHSDDMRLIAVVGNETHFAIHRSKNGQHEIESQKGAKLYVPELALLDPDPEIRLRGLQNIQNQNLCYGSSLDIWRESLENAPLTDAQLYDFIQQRSTFPRETLRKIGNMLDQGGFTIDDIIPSSRIYYEALIGSVLSCNDAAEYIDCILIPHLKTLIEKDFIWGLSCIEGCNITDRIDPVSICAKVSDETISDTLAQRNNANLPYAVLTTYQLALARAASISGLNDVAQRAINVLADNADKRLSDQAGVPSLYAAFVSLTLFKLGSTEEFRDAPPYWKRLAASTHANLLCAAAKYDDKFIESLVEWAAKHRSIEHTAIAVLDHVKDPTWHLGNQYAEVSWQLTFIRARQIASSYGIAPPTTFYERFSESEVPLKFIALSHLYKIPDLLSGRPQKSTNNGQKTLSLDVLKNLDAGKKDLPHQVALWSHLSLLSYSYAFDETLIEHLYKVAVEIIDSTMSGADDELNLIQEMALIAASQQNLSLAEVTATKVIRRLPEIDEPEQLLIHLILILVASGFAGSYDESLEWSGKKLDEFALKVKLGAFSEKFLFIISTFQKFIPVRKRKWSRAIALASAAVA